MKILVVADSPTVKTGFSRVSEQICLGLQNKGHTVVLLGINDPAVKHSYPFHIYPAFSTQGQDVMGTARLPYIVREEKPDVVLLFNDIWVCERYYKTIKESHQAGDFKVYTYFPIDSEGYIYPMVKWLEDLDGVATYTQFGVDVLRAAEFTGNVKIFSHGIDTKTFYPIKKDVARKAMLANLPEDAFIVLNANRNQPRKQIDLTIKAFAKFAQDKEDVWLYLHMGAKDVGWDVIPLFEKEMRRLGNPVDRLIMTSSSPNISSVSEEQLNFIYNCADVCLNTSQGEGFSLTNAEASICGIPQVVPNYSACKELWGEGRGLLADIAEYITDKDLFLERAIVSTENIVYLLNSMYNSLETRKQIGNKARSYFLQPQFKWTNILRDMERWLKPELFGI